MRQNQFLIVADDKPGIRKLRYLAIKPDKPSGVTTFISGKSQGIAVGLYPQFPIAEIKPSLLSQYLSSEAIAAILGSLATFTILVLEKIMFRDDS